jgi:hypothetical protein
LRVLFIIKQEEKNMRKDNILRRINTIISDLKSIERKVENNEMEAYDLEKLYRELDNFLYIINQF